jgi:O-antigen ligase
VLIGQSRSFWVGLIAALIVLIIYLLKDKLAWRVWLKFIGLAVMSVTAGLLIMTALVKLPGLGAWNALSQRTNLDESAVASRWNLIPKLWQAIKVSPIVGQGFGKTITYQSSDPRVLEQSADGTYETYAFEWGWLDLWLKMGILGILTYLLLLIKLIRTSLTQKQIGLALCLIALATVHFFTPYLNHPLGLGVIMLSAVFLNNTKRE